MKKKYDESTFVDNVYIDVYSHVINLIVDDSVYKGLKSVGRLDGRKKKFFKNTGGIFNISRSGNWCIVLDRNELNMDTIAHEAFHCAKQVLEMKSIKIADGSLSSEEALAYLIGYIVREIVALLIEGGEIIDMKRKQKNICRETK